MENDGKIGNNVLFERESCFGAECASPRLPVPPDSTDPYISMQLCHFCGMQSFVSGPLVQFASLQQAYKTAQPEVRPSPPRR